MIRTNTPTAMTVILLLIAACASSPPVHYFGLESLDVEYREDPPDSPLVVLGPLQLPDYLKRSQMVTRGDGTEFLVDDFNRWAEPLDQAIHRILAKNVDSLLDTMVVSAYPTVALARADYRLTGRIDRFDADGNGHAVLAVQWGMADADGTVLVATRRGQYEAQVSNPGGPAATARAMSDTLTQFSRDIGKQLEAMPR